MILSHLKNFFILIRWFHSLLALLPFVAIYVTVQHYKLTEQSCNIANAEFVLLCLGVELLMAAGFILNDICDN